jgi:hypothetical protein
MTPRECSGGTAYDHTEAGASFCKTANDIFLQNICTPTTPWTRCKTTSNVTGMYHSIRIIINIIGKNRNDIQNFLKYVPGETHKY